MIFYFVAFIFLVGFKLERKTYCILATVILILFAGLRADCVGADTVQYKTIYEQSLTFSSLTQLLRWRSQDSLASEIGYNILQYFCHLYVNYNVFKFICVVFTLVPVGIFIYKYSRKPAISFFVFYALPIYTMLSMSVMRQGIAFGLTVLAMDKLLEKRWKYYVLLILLACLFHQTAIILLPLYFIHKIKYKRKHNILIITLAVIVFIFRAAIFMYLNEYSRIDYKDDVSEGGGGGWGMLIFLILMFATSYFVPEKTLKQDFHKFTLLLLSFTLICWFLGLNLAAIFRLAAYTEFYMCLYVSNTLAHIPSKGLRYLVTTLICIGVLFIMSRVVIRESDGTVNSFYPYYFNWEKK